MSNFYNDTGRAVFSVGATNRYTLGDAVESQGSPPMYRILDHGTPTDALASYGGIYDIYDECEITGGKFTGGEYYSGSYMSGRFGGGAFFGGTYIGGVFSDGLLFHSEGGLTNIGHNTKYDHYISETGGGVYA